MSKIAAATLTAALSIAFATAPASAAPVRSDGHGAGHGHPTPGVRCSADASLLGFSDSLDKTTFEGTPVAGLSAISPTRPGRALALVDNIGTTPARVYELGLDRRGSAFSAAVRDVMFLKRPDGTAFTGADFDGEGLVAEDGGRTVLASSETEPTIRRFRLSDGREIASLPVPDRFRVAPAGQATLNQTFEALAATPDGRALFAGMEGPLSADGRDAAGRGLQRIIRYDGRSGGRYGVGAQYAYRTDPGLGLVELVAVDDNLLLALERGFTTGIGNTVRVYRVSASGATDVSTVDSLGTLTDPRVWLGKQLLVDLVDCPPSGATAKQAQPNPLLDNIEGMALGGRLPGDRRELYLISDDNNGATQTTRVYDLSVRVRPDARLDGRAILPATVYQPGPVSGTQLPPTTVNGITPPFPGQPIPGFSAVIPAPPGGTTADRLLAMPDNGFGAKNNSADFLLLTGADFDIESFSWDAHGDLWIGDEFGPYLIHADRTGKVLGPPVPLPDGTKSPQSPDLAPGETPTQPASRGFEAMAGSNDGWTLYPILEGAKVADPDVLPRRTAVDLMRITDPRGVSTPSRANEYGVGPLSSFPLQSVESVLPLRGDEVVVANDNNFPGNDGRIPGRPDDTEIIVITIPGLREAP